MATVSMTSLHEHQHRCDVMLKGFSTNGITGNPQNNAENFRLNWLAFQSPKSFIVDEPKSRNLYRLTNKAPFGIFFSGSFHRQSAED